MFKHHYTLLLSFMICCICTTLLQAQNEEIPESIQDEFTPKSRPNWLKLKNKKLTKEDFFSLIDETQGGNEPSVFELKKTTEDKKGRLRYVYQQYYKDVLIENHRWILHEKNEKLFVAQGQFFKKPFNKASQADLTKEQALVIALDQSRAQKYAWEIPALEQNLKLVRGNDRATYFPNPKLVWIAKKRNNKLQLAYRVKVYSVDPIAKKRYYIHAKTGEILLEEDLLHTGCFEKTPHHAAHPTSTHHHAASTSGNFLAPGTGIANYIATAGGEVSITTAANGAGFTLFTEELGPDGNQILHTQNANNNWHYETLTDFEDADNIWDADPTAVGAHWGMEQVYDYFLTTFDRKSFDDNGSPMINVIHYGQNLVNAYWDGVQMTYGDGDGTKWGALTSLDIIGHEFTHGVTENNGTGGLSYIDDSGALNESFSDIFGAVIEFKYHPDGGDWWIGEDFDLENGEGFRSMANPNLKGHPKTYLGNYWYDSGGDNGGVHFNSGVQNHWFYLLSEGGSGTNEFGQNYDITPLGMDIAAEIAYYNLTRYMTPNSTYQDAKEGSLDAALLLYPTDLSIHNTVEAAWCAVGIGEGCGPTIDVMEPALNEAITAGKTYTITWQSELLSSTSKVKIEYALENVDDPLWYPITDNVPNDGTYDWLVPSEYSNTVRIRITDDGDPAAGRVSNKDILGISEKFEIDACIATNSFNGPKTAAINEAIEFTSNISGDSYEWKIDGQVVGTSPDLSYTFEQPGIYEMIYTVNSTDNGCFNEERRRLYIIDENSSGFTVQIGDIDNGGGRAYGQEILQTRDGGYIFTSLFTSLVFKFDALGNLIWKSNALPTPTYGNYRMIAIEKADGTILVVMGHSQAGSAIANDNLLLIDIDGVDGTIINNTSKQLEVDGRLMAHQIIATDTSFIIGGAYQTTSDQDVFLLNLKADDYSILDQNWFGDSELLDYYGELIPTSDGGYMLGWIQAGNYPAHFGLLKLDQHFQEEWKQGISSYRLYPGIRSRMQILETPDCGGYMILADADEYANSALVKINTLGNVLWAKRYSNPEALDGSLISFQNMVWDGQEGVTLLGINGTKLNSNNYPEAVDFQLLNVSYDGQINWKRKVTDLEVILPASPSYNLFVSDLLLAADGGYLASIPCGDGGETNLIKMDAIGLDGCVLTNTTVEEEDITTTFNVELEINTLLNSPPTIQSGADYPFNVSSPTLSIGAPACGLIGGELIAAFTLVEKTILINTTPTLIDLSRGATESSWFIDGQATTYPFAPFSSAGKHTITLEVTDGTDSSQVSYVLNVVTEEGCELVCDLTQEQARTIAATCPDSDDGQIYTEVSSEIGRTFKYELYDDAGELIVRQPTGFFTNLATGDYQVKVASDNDESCVLDLGTLTLSPKVDNSPPKALCLSAAVDIAFVHAAIGVPYNHGNYVNEMNAAVGTDWHQLIYESVDPKKLFSDSYHYIYLEGSDNNAEELEAFIGANLSLMEEWVAAGNVLLINAAPNEGDGMDVGFGGVQFVRGTYNTALAVDASLPMFVGPRTPMTTTFSGYPYNKAAVICPPTMNATRILESENGTDLLVQAEWGAGKVVFGGMNLTGFHTPSTETYNFKINLLHYLKGLPIPTLNSPFPIELDATQHYELTAAEIDLGSSDDCGLESTTINVSEFTCQDIGIVEVTLSVTDVANNETTCVTKVEIFSYPILTEIAEMICEGEIYDFHGQSLDTAGTYQATLQNYMQCDSIVEITLGVIAKDQTSIDTIICQGDSYVFDGQFLMTSGTYERTLQNINGCDSVISLTLTIAETHEIQVAESICDGEIYSFNGQEITLAGTYRDTLQNVHACDSIVELTLDIRTTSDTVLTKTICQGELFDFGTENLTVAGIYERTLQNIHQCDSVISLTLTVLESHEIQLAESICDGEIYSFNDRDITLAGTYRDTLQNVHACDSIVVLTLDIRTTSDTVLTKTICQGESFDFGTENLTVPGIYEKTLQNIHQCDSVISLTLTIAEADEVQVAESICDGEIYSFNGRDITLAGTYRDTLQNVHACDSIVVLTLDIRTTSDTVLTKTICQGELFDFGTENLTVAGIYEKTLQNIHQCDSVISLTLTVLEAHEIQLAESICDGEIYSFNGRDITLAGTYRDTLQNLHACDSIVVLTLDIRTTSDTVLTKTICQGELFDFGTENLTVAGIYEKTLQNIHQCDSVISLTLTIAEADEVQVAESICDGEIYPFNGRDISLAGTYRDTLQNVHACDSIVELTLDIRTTSDTILTKTICQGESFDFGTQNLTVAGVYEKTLQNIHQCDSVVSVILFVENCNDCPDDQVILNQDPIPKNTYTALYSIEATGTVALDTVTFLAGGVIDLKPGFLADFGSNFLAEITPFMCADPGSLMGDTVLSRSRSLLVEEQASINENELRVSPNPFKSLTTISFQLSKPQEITLGLYTADGRLLSILRKEYLPDGDYTQPIHFGESKGVFFIVLKTDTEILTRKIIGVR